MSSKRTGAWGLVLAAACVASPVGNAMAQNQPPRTYGPVTPGEEDEQPDCPEPETPDEIVVCARFEDGEQYRIPPTPDARDNPFLRKDIRAPNVDGDGIFKGDPTFALPPPVPVLLIDLEAIPETPPGSDADRVGRGLAPKGNELGDAPKRPGAQEEESDAEEPGAG